jgi:hypothetical protein
MTRLLICIGMLLGLALGACTPVTPLPTAPLPTSMPPTATAPPDSQRSFQNDDLVLVLPTNWRTLSEIWGPTYQVGRDYRDLGVKEIVTVADLSTGCAELEYTVWATLAGRPLASGEILKGAVETAYAGQVTPSRNFTLGPCAEREECFEARYLKAWGEPWWAMRDVWLAHGGKVYVLSLGTTPGNSDGYQDWFASMVAGLRFK